MTFPQVLALGISGGFGFYVGQWVMGACEGFIRGALVAVQRHRHGENRMPICETCGARCVYCPPDGAS